jgi:drug/metabolite transporter (DMT)-like permease
LLALTAAALLAFAGNSLLCRLALRGGDIDAASFTSLRLLSGALVLALLARWRRRGGPGAAADRGSWRSALALFVYAAGFSFAYLGLSAATGALLLFAAVQACMLGHGLWRGERLRGAQWLGLALAGGGLLVLLAPGLAAPPWPAALLMIAAGLAWGVYSLRGRGAGDAVQVTAGNFLRAVPMAAVLSLALAASATANARGVAAALASGALASGLGYAIWYSALPRLRASSAAIVQLSVPVLAALGGAVWLAEPLTPRLLLAAASVLGGIALATLSAAPARPPA